MRVIYAAFIIVRRVNRLQLAVNFYPERYRDFFNLAAFLPVFCPESVRFGIFVRTIHKGVVRDFVINLQRQKVVVAVFRFVFQIHRLVHLAREFALYVFAGAKDIEARKSLVADRAVFDILFIVLFFEKRGKIYAKVKPAYCKVAVAIDIALNFYNVVGSADDKVAIGKDTSRKTFKNDRVEVSGGHLLHGLPVHDFFIPTVYGNIALDSLENKVVAFIFSAQAVVRYQGVAERVFERDVFNFRFFVISEAHRSFLRAFYAPYVDKHAVKRRLFL